MAGLSRDEFAYERRGRIVGEDEYRSSIKRRAREILSLGPPGGARLRAGGATGGAASISRGLSTESVLKVIAWTKGQHAAPRQALYIGRARDKDDAGRQVPLENERGELVQGKAEIQAEIASWELLTDARNRSAAWRRATPEDRVAMGQAEALAKRQAVHLMFSVPRGAPSQAEALRDAVREAMRESFGEAGYRYFFAIHTDEPRRPHAHIIVKATSEPIAGCRARQLRLNPRELEAIRERLTGHARERGFDVTCTRRVDREETRRNIVVGNEPLRVNLRQGELHCQGQSRQGSVFEAKAPNWYLQHGLAYEQRRSEPWTGGLTPANTEKPPRPGGLLGRLTRVLSGAFRRQEVPDAREAPKLPDPPVSPSPALARLDRHFAEVHQNPTAARDSFLAMYNEAPKLAVWAANNHPQAFGKTTGAPPTGTVTGRGLRAIVTQDALTPEVAANGRPAVETARATRQARQAADISREQSRQRRDAAHVPKALLRVADRLASQEQSQTQVAEIQKLAANGGQPDHQGKAAGYRALDARLKDRDRYQLRRGDKDKGIDR